MGRRARACGQARVLPPQGAIRGVGGPRESGAASVGSPAKTKHDEQGDRVKTRAFVQLLGAAAWTGPGALAQAPEPGPRRPIRVIVPVTAGGTADVLAREFGRRIGEPLGQPVVVENRPGANGIPATRAGARAPADGYTLLLTLTQHIQNPVQFKDAGYDPIADFTPLCRIG